MKNESTNSSAGGVDDGPRFAYGNTTTYRKYAKRMADKLGMSVEDWLMDMGDDLLAIGGRDVIDTVSYFPTGDPDSTNAGTDYHAAVSSEKAYSLWAARAERLATIANDVTVVRSDGEESKSEPLAESVGKPINECGCDDESPEDELTEIGDASAKPFPITSRSERMYGDSKYVNVDFKTDGMELDYQISLDFEDDMMGVDFGLVTNDSNSTYDTTNNYKELFRIMATVINVVKDELAKMTDTNIIVFNSSALKRGEKSSQGVDQRTRLYLSYIQREFPTAKVVKRDMTGNEYEMLVYLNGISERNVVITDGYKKYINDHIGDIGITNLAEMWINELPTEYADYKKNIIVDDTMLHILGEKTYKDLRRDAPNYLRIRDKSKKTPGSRYIEIDEDNIIHFKTPSHTHAGVTYDQKVKLLQLEELIQTHSGVKKPSQIVRMALAGDIKVHCTDPSWLYWGFQYIGTKDKYATDPEKRYPKIRNPQLKGSVCKHLDNVLFILPFQTSTIVKDLREQQRL